jgi:hypothetical protein
VLHSDRGSPKVYRGHECSGVIHDWVPADLEARHPTSELVKEVFSVTIFLGDVSKQQEPGPFLDEISCNLLPALTLKYTASHEFQKYTKSCKIRVADDLKERDF